VLFPSYFIRKERERLISERTELKAQRIKAYQTLTFCIIVQQKRTLNEPRTRENTSLWS
jgi:hypothetical protein